MMQSLEEKRRVIENCLIVETISTTNQNYVKSCDMDINWIDLVPGYEYI